MPDDGLLALRQHGRGEAPLLILTGNGLSLPVSLSAWKNAVSPCLRFAPHSLCGGRGGAPLLQPPVGGPPPGRWVAARRRCWFEPETEKHGFPLPPLHTAHPCAEVAAGAPLLPPRRRPAPGPMGRSEAPLLVWTGNGKTWFPRCLRFAPHSLCGGRGGGRRSYIPCRRPAPGRFIATKHHPHTFAGTPLRCCSPATANATTSKPQTP